MFKKLFSTISLVLVLAFAGAAMADTWDNHSSIDNSWHTATNWDSNTVPPDANDAIIPGITGGTDANYPVIKAGLDANAGIVQIGGISGNEGRLTMEAGSSLTTYGMNGSSNIQFGLALGWGNPGGGMFINNGGDVNTGQEVWIGYRPEDMIPGKVYMNAGTWVHHGIFDIARSDDCPSSGPPYPSAGHVHLKGGTIDTEILTFRNTLTNCINAPDYIPLEDVRSQGWMDINGGTLIVNGNQRARLFQLNDPCGWLTAYGVGNMGAPGVPATIVTHPRARLVVDYNWRTAIRTTATAYKAEPNEAYALNPGPYDEGILPYVTLTWKPGDYVGNDGKYLGVVNPQKGDGHHIFLDTHNTYMKNDSAKQLLNYPIGTQYGHIGKAQDANSYTIGVTDTNYLGGLKVNTVYYWCIVEANDANLAAGDRAWKSLVQAFMTLNPGPTDPNPAAGAELSIPAGAALQYQLGWGPGFYVADTNNPNARHKVYFGSDFNEVNDTGGAYGDLRLVATTANPIWQTPTLKIGQTYYWRILEVNSTGPDPNYWSGPTWSFSVGMYRGVDEFAYTNNAALHVKWLDYMNDGYSPACSQEKNGSMISGGGGLMSYDYDDNDRQDLYNVDLDLDLFSEIKYEYASPVSWKYGDDSNTIWSLVIRLRGNAANEANAIYDRMYIGVEDSTGKRADVNNPDALAQQKLAFAEWNIDLNDFVKAKPGLNLGSISKVYLGFGRKCNPYNGTPGGEGVVAFDYIRLYPRRCVGLPGYRQPADLSGDCTVNMTDVDVFVNAWLQADRLTGGPVAVPDNDPCLLAWYKFENGYLNDANGRAGTSADGTAYGTVSTVVDANRPLSSAGNKVLYVDQTDGNDYVLTGTWNGLSDFNNKSFTVTTWEKRSLQTEWGCMVCKGEAAWKLQYFMVASGRPNTYHFATHILGAVPSQNTVLGQWYHAAASFEFDPTDPNRGGIMRVYVNGRQGTQLVNSGPYNPSHVAGFDPNVCLGCKDGEGNGTDQEPGITNYYAGYLDDIRVYDRKLSEEEIMWIAGVTTPNYYAIPVPYIYADIHSPEAQGSKSIQFKDFALLAQDWMKSDLWPLSN